MSVSRSRLSSRLKYIVGTDLSLTDSGVVVIDRDGELVDSFCIKTKAGPVDHVRIDDIVTRYFHELQPYMKESDAIAFMFEDVMFSGRTSAKAGARFGLCHLIQWMLRQEKCRQAAITPGAWKSVLLYPYKLPSGSKPQKQAVNAACEAKFGFKTNNLNVSDARGIANAGLLYFIQDVKLSVRSLT